MEHSCINCYHLKENGHRKFNCDHLDGNTYEELNKEVNTPNNCNHFKPRIIDSQSMRMGLSSQFINIINLLKFSPVIGSSMERFTYVPSGTHFWTKRGIAMLQLSDDNLSKFENDNSFKTYDINNGCFIELLHSQKVRNPIIFWLSNSNPPGAFHISISSKHLSHHVLRIGKPYTFENIIKALTDSLCAEDIKLKNHWFVNFCLKQMSVDITTISEASLYVFDKISQH